MNFLRIILIAVAVFFSAFMGWSSYQKIRIKRQAEAQAELLPAFEFSDLQGRLFNASNVSRDAERIVINYFHPDCDHCQFMASTMAKEADSLEGIQLIMVSYADSASVRSFYNTYQLKRIKNLVVLTDRKYQFFNYFGTAAIPSFLVYNKKFKLIKRCSGETKVSYLLH